MKTLLCENGEVPFSAAELLLAFLRKHPHALILTAYDSTLKDVFSAVAAAGERFPEARIAGLTEIDDGQGTVSAHLKAELAQPLGIKEENMFFPKADNAEEYDSILAGLGKPVIALLGLGYKGQYCFIEPGTQFISRTHVRTFSKSTRQMLAFLYGVEKGVPERGITAGVSTVNLADCIVVAAQGSEMAEAVFETLYARDDSTVPSAFLQIPADVTVVTDRDAAARL